MRPFVKKCDDKDDGGTCMLLSDACVTDEGGLEHIRIYTGINIGRAENIVAGLYMRFADPLIGYLVLGCCLHIPQ